MGKSAKIRYRRRRRETAFYRRCSQVLTQDSVLPALLSGAYARTWAYQGRCPESWEERVVREITEAEDALFLASLEERLGP